MTKNVVFLWLYGRYNLYEEKKFILVVDLDLFTIKTIPYQNKKIPTEVVTKLHINNDNIIFDFPHTFGNIHYKEFINKWLD
jgi:hypothetical protein